MATTETAAVRSLKPHPLSAKIYGANEPLDGLLDSIREHGILTPLTVTTSGIVISGRRRLLAAGKLGLERVPVIRSPLTDPLDIEQAVIENNRYRQKTNEQKSREYAALKRLEAERAKRRMAQGGRKSGETRRKGQKAGMTRHELTVPASEGVANLPHLHSKSRDLAAAQVGLRPRTAEKGAAVVEYADATGDREVLDTLNNKSADAAYAQVKRKTGQAPAAPPFKAQYTNVWTWPAPTPGFGQDYPGRIPGDLVRNLLWLYTQPDDLVVDTFAGGGVTADVCAWWGGQPDLWPVRCLSYDLVPARPEIHFNDVMQAPYIPTACRGAGLFFLDPPYWKQKQGDYSDHPTNLANLDADAFHAALVRVLKMCALRLRPGGHVALLIGATQGGGEFTDHAAVLAGSMAGLKSFVLVQRVIVPYTSQQFRPPDVAWARDNRQLLKAYRDLMVFQLPE